MFDVFHQLHDDSWRQKETNNSEKLPKKNPKEARKLRETAEKTHFSDQTTPQRWPKKHVFFCRLATVTPEPPRSTEAEAPGRGFQPPCPPGKSHMGFWYYDNLLDITYRVRLGLLSNNPPWVFWDFGLGLYLLKGLD